MCGIAGVAAVEGSANATVMREMRDRLVHRGPDSGGEYVDEHVALGVRRLKIIDLLTGDQPQANETRSVWTVFNGEIYNFHELREELAGRGHRLATASDTEVIVHLYEEVGWRFVERLDGMFALAVWDTRTKTLVLARDRLGKKPLLYREANGTIHFASEHQALLAGLGRRPGVDPDAIRLYLRLGFVPAPRDAFAGVRKLAPAHVLVWRDGRSTLHRYWSTPAPGTLRIDEGDAIQELRRLLTRAVARRLVSDVPVGAFLSGGVDSSAVVATMAALSSKVRTFTIGFREAEFSELAYARDVAERFGTEHREFVVGPGEVDVLPALVRHYGEPYADSSAVPTYFLSKLTRDHVTVALSGDGGDELFAGYERYFAVRLASSLDRLPALVRVPALGAAARLLPDSVSPFSPLRRARRFLQAAALPPRERYLRWLGVFDGEQLARLLSPEFARVTADAERVGELAREDGFTGPDPVAAAQALDLGLYLPDDLLVKVDIASMANSLEVRCPFLDRELVEFAVRLPTSLKMRGAERKYLVKRAFEGTMPAANLHRRKQGFGVPIGAWFRGDLRHYAEDILLSANALGRGYFRRAELEELVRAHTAGAEDHTHRVWALLFLELWHREFVDR
jgi:asparagine synthase (glutamine-hydrolysing)